MVPTLRFHYSPSCKADQNAAPIDISARWLFVKEEQTTSSEICNLPRVVLHYKDSLQEHASYVLVVFANQTTYVLFKG
jgi:hypothetical protein